MSDSNLSSRRRTRNKGPESAARSEALQRLKSLRTSTNRRSEPANVQIKLSDPIYDSVPESDYNAIVAKRRDDFRDFIVDDDGLGYTDDGQEEDWTNPNPNYEEEDNGSGSDKELSKKKKKDDTKKAPKPLPNPVVKQRISSMFTSSVFKKNESSKKMGSLVSESIIDDVLAEFAPDENDREERRRRSMRNIPDIKLKTEVRTETRNQEVVPRDDLDVNNGYVDCGNDAETVPEKADDEAKVNENVKSEEKVEFGENVELEKTAELEKNDLRLEEEKKAFCLNAKIKVEEKDNKLCATEEWKTACGVNGNIAETSSNVDENSEFELNADGLLPFYIIDAHEEAFGGNQGVVYLFGKVKVGGAYHSCCIIVNNMQRCVYAIPNSSVFPRDKIDEIEVKAKESQDPTATFRANLQEMASDLKSEVAENLLKRNVSSFSMMPVKRSYAFERTDIPLGNQYVLKINYPFKDPPLSSDLRGENFISLMGTNSSALELFLIKRKIMGPSWLSISKFVSCPSSQRVSWCKFEIVVNCPKDVSVASSNTHFEVPPLVVGAINLKTIISSNHNVNEIVAASIVCCHKAKIDGPMIASEWKRKGVLSHFTVVRKPEGGIFPMGLKKEVDEKNSKAGSNILAMESSERALLNRLMIELHKLDCDALVGHNISGFDLDVLLHRAQACKVPSSMWSKIGRLKRSVMPKLTKGSSLYGSGASLGIISCIAGRLLCDTYLCSRDLLREVSYSLTHLAKTQLSKDRTEVSPHDIPGMFQTSKTLLQLVEYGETDAWLSLELMFHLSILPLTWQLTRICGNLWGKTLQGARAQRVEYYLLHSFHERKYIVPDKYSAQNKEVTTIKRKSTATVEGEDAEKINDIDDCTDTVRHTDRVKGRKGPAYAGGLVLEPKKGLYDKYILLLDFNSLYPSIIQEYNICFTTVERSSDGQSPNLPTSNVVGVLPTLLKSLVERRRMVKSWMKTASGLKVQQFDIQQQALKLTANSMYGCLGFSNSRFYAKPLAELITLQGREILQSTVELVQNKLNLEVIYGDTDSIMIYSGLDDIDKAKSIATKVISEVNKKYRCLEIDLDGMYKRMLLLKKKKYAAVKVQFRNGKPYEIIERKGLDMVRRDWSLLSKEIGDFCLSQILSGGTCEDVVETIHDSLIKVKEEMRNSEIELQKYVITKTLTKPPEDYPDAKNQPHVQVALRLKQQGYTGCSPGDTIPYIICCQQGDTGSHSTGIAQRARHPDELKKDNDNWMIDIDYYLSQQIHPVVSRLCASIEGTSPARLADCLGLDSSKFQRTVDSVTKDTSSVLLSVVDDSERYNGCEPLWLSCPSCSCTFECPPASTLVSILVNENISDSGEEKKQNSNFWLRTRCTRCPEDIEGGKISPAMIANQVKRQAENFMSLYYKGTLVCDDEMCKYTTRAPNLRVIGDSERGTVCPNYPRCNGRLIRQYTEADLYKQLSYFCYVVDTKRCIDKVDLKFRVPIERELANVQSYVELATSEIQKIRDRCAYGWVQLHDLAVSI